jgi:hypothetical protein
VEQLAWVIVGAGRLHGFLCYRQCVVSGGPRWWKQGKVALLGRPTLGLPPSVNFQRLGKVVEGIKTFCHLIKDVGECSQETCLL